MRSFELSNSRSKGSGGGGHSYASASISYCRRRYALASTGNDLAKRELNHLLNLKRELIIVPRFQRRLEAGLSFGFLGTNVRTELE